ncbi:insoluble matrix shell protein, partial [Acrasis kona]
MRVYSSRRNPTWVLKDEERTEFLSLADSLFSDANKCDTIYVSQLGYTGFEVVDSKGGCIHVINNKKLESHLLKSYIKFRSESNDDPTSILSVVNHVTEVISTGIDTSAVQKQSLYSLSPNEILRGPDNVTRFNPGKWSRPVEALRLNNCYNYATDVRTDTFAQPGRGGTGKDLSVYTCSEIWDRSIKDGLNPLGKKCPKKEAPVVGHYVSLVMWPGEDFHWYRKDLEKTWSHKPGTGYVLNRDRGGNIINNPDEANISPYTEICGYYVAIP